MALLNENMNDNNNLDSASTGGYINEPKIKHQNM